jgi:hypothetical protein
MGKFEREHDEYVTRDNRYEGCCDECGGEFDGTESDDATMCARCDAEGEQTALVRDAVRAYQRNDRETWLRLIGLMTPEAFESFTAACDGDAHEAAADDYDVALFLGAPTEAPAVTA